MNETKEFVPSIATGSYGTLLTCMCYYLYSNESGELQQKIQQELMLYLCNLCFNSSGPFEAIPDDFSAYTLRTDVYTHGVIRMLVYRLSQSDPFGKVPEKAKHYYLQQPAQMKQSITSFITTLCEGRDAYTMCHAFGDKYGIEVYVNEYHIQACAGVPLGYVGHVQRACFSEKSNGQYTLCLSVKTHNVSRHRIQ
jgi:hypothetical protein